MEAKVSQPISKQIWKRFAEIDAISIETNNSLNKWLVFFAVTTILAALLANITPLFDQLNIENWNPFLQKVLVILPALGSTIVALNYFLNKQIGIKKKQEDWVKLRSYAEFIKSEIFKYNFGSSEYLVEDKNALLIDKLNFTNESLMDIEQKYPKSDHLEPYPNIQNNNIGNYMTERIDNQINYYTDKIKHYTKKEKLFKNIILLLGILSVLFTGLANFEEQVVAFTGSGKINIIGLFAAAIVTSFMLGLDILDKKNKYKKLINAYDFTKKGLEVLKLKYESTELKNDPGNFISLCEKLMDVEHRAWAAMWTDNNYLPDIEMAKSSMETETESVLQ